MAPTLTANCPYCGQKHNLRVASIDTIKKCSRCGKKFEVKLPPRRWLRGAFVGILRLAAVILVGACVWVLFCKDKAPKDQGKEKPPDLLPQNPKPAPGE